MRWFVLLICVAVASLGHSLIAAGDDDLVKAKKEFPDLANPDSIFAKAYTAEEAQLRKTQPDFFTNENWPLMLAYRVATKLGISSAAEGSDNSTSQASPAPTPANASATEDEATAAQKISPFILTLKGDQGSGSGFVLKRGSKFYLVTNAHVVEGNKNIKVASINKEFPMPSQILVSKTRDIVMAELSGFDAGLESQTDFSQVRIGDITIALGNSSGAGVSRLVKGKVLGIGNDLVETDGAYVQGNSGSPIIHLNSGKVLGVVTFVESSPKDKLVERSDLTDLRYFAQRIDNLTDDDMVAISEEDFTSVGNLAQPILELNSTIRAAADNALQEGKWGLDVADAVYAALGISGNKSWEFGGRCVGLDDIPDRLKISKLPPRQKQQLHVALKERLEQLDAMEIESNVLYRQCYVQVDKSGRAMLVNFRQNVKNAMVAAGSN